MPKVKKKYKELVVPKCRIMKKKIYEAMCQTLGVLEPALKMIEPEIQKRKALRRQFYRWMASDIEFNTDINSIEDISLDFAESKLKENMSKGSTTDIIFYLKTKGRKRGYEERSTVVNENKEPLKIEIGKQTEQGEKNLKMLSDFLKKENPDDTD